MIVTEYRVALNHIYNVKGCHVYFYDDVHELSIFIARQHAMHAERDIVAAILSVCPSSAGSVSNRMDDISSHFFEILTRASF